MRAAVARIGVRVGAALLILLAVSVVLFVAIEALPGDAAARILGQNATPGRLEALREELGLDQSLVVRYLSWLADTVRLELGEASTSDRTVWETIRTPLRNSAIFASVAMVAISVVAVGGGLASGRRPGSITDRVVSTTALGLVAVPEFVTAGILVSIFAFGLGWFSSVSLVPLGGTPLSDPTILVLPVLTAALFGGAYGLRLIRAVVADASSSAHVEAARLAGVSERRVMTRHLVPTIAGPTVQTLALLVPYLVAGTVVIERVFAYPGLGSLLVDQIAAQDVAVVEAIGMIMAVIVVVAFLVADLVGAATNTGAHR
jgi:peptide/nickel transport system permease protein